VQRDTPAMAVVVVCILLAVGGLAAIVAWRGEAVQPLSPPAAAGQPRPVREVVLRYLRWVNITTAVGLLAGVLAAGPGGRLAMRLLAVTADPDALGRITEAGETVGEITVDGTIGFFVFSGVLPGVITAAMYLVVYRGLPPGLVGGLVYGLLLLVLFGSRLDPLRRDNPDFDIVGPGWVALVSFSAVVVLHGALIAVLAGRISRSLPLPRRSGRVLAAYAPLMFLVLFFPFGVFAVLVGGLVVAVSRVPALAPRWGVRRRVQAGRVALAVLGVLALPGFVATAADIASRG
jgi:hypothetical protein